MNLSDPIDLSLLACIAVLAIACPIALIIPGAVLLANVVAP